MAIWQSPGGGAPPADNWPVVVKCARGTTSSTSRQTMISHAFTGTDLSAGDFIEIWAWWPLSGATAPSPHNYINIGETDGTPNSDFLSDVTYGKIQTAACRSTSSIYGNLPVSAPSGVGALGYASPGSVSAVLSNGITVDIDGRVTTGTMQAYTQITHIRTP